jgi:phosphoenolpyruvate carboxykinase (diphosphate)
MDLKKSFGFGKDGTNEIPRPKRLNEYINLKLAAMGQPVVKNTSGFDFLELANDLIKNYREKSRLLATYLSPADQRIQNFLDTYLEEYKDKVHPRLPSHTFITDSHGIARALSLPPDKDEFVSDIISSYRIKQGVLHNPRNDRRTTEGVFHIAEGGLPIPDDKKSIPKLTFALLLNAALHPPRELMQLPFCFTQEEKAEVFVSLLLKPVVSPGVPGVSPEKRMEIRFFAPGNLVSNLDFVESIFGNGGDPFLPENDSALDIEGWTGHSGCIILAPHLVGLTKKEVALPVFTEASERQKRDGMCWKEESEKYNDGNSFKITARTDEGIIVTIIADNYFGYSKKEVKTQISYSANLYGNTEEEHAGGAIAFPSYNLGDEFRQDSQIRENGLTFETMIEMYASFMEPHPEGYASDKNYPDIIYVPRDANFSLVDQKITWKKNGEPVSIRLKPACTYILPAGYKIRMEKNPAVPSWRLIGTAAEGTFTHKPCTVSGGGKSEISKSINDAIIYGPYFTADFEADFKHVEEIINKDYNNKFKDPKENDRESRPVLSSARSLGSVIKLLTPSPTLYNKEYNHWLESIPHYIKGLVYIVKRHYKPEWGNDWKKHFSVDIIDGKFGNELKFHDRKIVASYLRIGLMNDKSWRTFKLRQDFVAADKLQMEDDITASTVVPANRLQYLSTDHHEPAVKITYNCEYRFFQRPDEAIHRGYDKQAEADLATPNTFISNFQPLTVRDAVAIMDDAIEFDKYTTPIKRLIEDVVAQKDCTFFVSPSHPRIFEGKPSKNMRYLQNRPDIVNHRGTCIDRTGIRLFRKISIDREVILPVNAVLAGRRNNPPEPGIRPLAVYNPIHYQELPELFMDFICSLTGKSPSTTGAGTEGALTKGPFNALSPVTDLNNALVSFILTGYSGFTSAAGFIGPNYRVDHDISLLVPEIWSRLRTEEIEPSFMIENGLLEQLNDFQYNNQTILASRLGYRITQKFVSLYFGRVFENPDAVFNEEMLKPELQGMEVFADGINNITEAQKRVAASYFADESIEGACPPLKALLHIMVNGNYEGKLIEDPELRQLFTRESLLKSDWYHERLLNKQLSDIALFQKHIRYLKNYLATSFNLVDDEEKEVQEKLKKAEDKLKYYKSTDYLKSLEGFIGLDPYVK